MAGGKEALGCAKTCSKPLFTGKPGGDRLLDRRGNAKDVATGGLGGTGGLLVLPLFLRAELGRRHGEAVAARVRIQYGGSVKPANARDLFGQPDIDGGLIGGASLEAPGFLDICRATR